MEGAVNAGVAYVDGTDASEHAMASVTTPARSVQKLWHPNRAPRGTQPVA